MNYLIYIFLFTFIFNENIRVILFSGISSNLYYNIPVLLIVIKVIFDKKIEKDKSFYVSALILFIYLIIITRINNKSIGFYLNPTFNYIIPIIFLSFRDIYNDKTQILKLIKILNVFIIFITLFGVVDFISNYKLNYLVQSFIGENGIKDLMNTMISYGGYRLFTIWGHPLAMAQYYIIYFILNWYANKYGKIKNNMFLITCIYMIGIILTGSKMALIVSVIIVIIYSSRNNNVYLKLASICFIISISLLLINTEFFYQNIVQRIESAIQAGDITNGRIGAMNAVKQTGIEPKYFSGGGYNFSREVTDIARTNNFEIPFIMLWYDYGLFFVLGLFYFSFGKEWLKIAMNQKYLALGLITLFIIYINSYNGLVYGDNLMRVVLTIRICSFFIQENIKDDCRRVINEKKELCSFS
ncbi:hypothetical protein H8S20_07440 [Clostridium sp. NSJ-6]|uniref:O-antigen ligase domain-containing protein n=1 Tax=Clostridium hominis TaxID=2763036 RepID=A0ABR7DBF7_9CLOT|nr:hypothetical protein [Clostridium hominis]MBC5628720.1 hypothetical protein [Clostridium hominis]